MNPDQLNSLLLDHALGELPSDVAALLEAHLARDPEAARRAADLQATLTLARRTLTPSAATTAPPLDAARLRRAVPAAAKFVPFRTELYRLAACLALGLAAGWFARPVAPTAERSAGPVPDPTRALVAPAEPRSTFWSVSRLTAGQRAAAAPAARLPRS